MNVLVLVGSKHGATLEIAAAIADQHKAEGHDATAAEVIKALQRLDTSNVVRSTS